MLDTHWSISNLALFAYNSKTIMAWVRYQLTKCNRSIIAQLLVNMPATDGGNSSLLPPRTVPNKLGELIWYKRQVLSHFRNDYSLYFAALYRMSSVQTGVVQTIEIKATNFPDPHHVESCYADFIQISPYFGYARFPMFDHQIKLLLTTPTPLMCDEDVQLLKKRRLE